MAERLPDENVRLVQYLVRKYKGEGWSIYTWGVDTRLQDTGELLGPRPDLVLVKDNKKMAICIESLASLKSGQVINKWRSIGKYYDTKATVIVRDKKLLDIANQVAVSDGIEIDAQIIKKFTRKDRQLHFSLSSLKRMRIIVLFLAILLIGFVFLISIELIDKLRMKDAYIPFDRERQMDFFRRRMLEMDRGR
jgi:hypothetical protein